MALYDKAVLAFSACGVRCFKGSEEHLIRLLLLEYSLDRYVLVIYRLTGTGAPAEVLLRVDIPDDRVTFRTCEKSGAVDISVDGIDEGSSYRLLFTRGSVAFWRVLEIIFQAKAAGVAREQDVATMIQDAMDTISVLHPETPPLTPPILEEGEIVED